MFTFLNIKLVIGLVILCIFLNYFCDKLGDNIEEIVEDIEMDTDVAGATFLAISSSLPELLTALVAIIVYGKFENVGFATVAGSGIFNTLLIPLASIMVYKGSEVTFSKRIAKRDISFYLATIFTLGISMYLGQLSWITGICLLGIYAMYVHTLMKGQSNKILWKDASFRNIFNSLFVLVPIALIINQAVKLSLQLSTNLGINGFITSVIVLACVTSVPDLMLSINESKKGDMESAVANAIGSNIFDLCVCLGGPLLITGSHIAVNFNDNLGVLFFLTGSVVVTAWAILTGAKRWKTAPMLLFYIGFIVYICNK